jgi:hypothetical protein
MSVTFKPVGIVLIVVVLLFGAVVACSRSDETAASFTVVNDAVNQLDLGPLGEVVLDQQYGRVGISADPPSRRLVIISGSSHDEAERSAGDHLTRAGFKQTAGGTWERGGDKTFVLVLLSVLGPGEQLPSGAVPDSVPSNKTGIVVQVSTRV